MTYAEAKALFAKARSKRNGKPLANNTRLMQRWIDDQECYAVRLHFTDVVTIFPDGTYQLKTGGFYTRTTKDRINQFSPAAVYQDKFIWYVGNSLFYEGMVVSPTGTPTRPIGG
jgi:hypothetical protein